MRRILLLSVCLVAIAARASYVRPNRLPRGEYADTEVTTNVPYAFGLEDARSFQFELNLVGSPSNNVQLAFGRDADSDGALAAEETDMVFAWDCGGWRIVNCEAGDVIESEAATTDNAKVFAWNLLLRRGRPRRLAALENGVPVFAELADAPEPWLYSPEWDILRLTVRGIDAPQESVRVGMEISGCRIIMR